MSSPLHRHPTHSPIQQYPLSLSPLEILQTIFHTLNVVYRLSFVSQLKPFHRIQSMQVSIVLYIFASEQRTMIFNFKPTFVVLF